MSGPRALTARLVCAGCGAVPRAPELEPFPFRCRAARPGDDIDHVVRPILEPTGCAQRTPDEVATEPRSSDRDSANPFVRYRTLFYSYELALSRGLSDAQYLDIVRQLDVKVGRVWRPGFIETPFGRSAPLSDALGFNPAAGVWVKDETGNVSGSHKGRHLMGVAIYLDVLARTGLMPRPIPTLAIASCGNAALAAAVIARAASRRLQVFVPPDANRRVVGAAGAMGAEITTCPREAGVPGDPSYRRFREALGPDVIPFSCQGSDTGLAIEGGETLAWEMMDALGGLPDRLFVQVGGGMLASACIQGFLAGRADVPSGTTAGLGSARRSSGETPPERSLPSAARRREVPTHPGLPRIHAVQTEGAHPLKRAYDLLVARLFDRVRDGVPATLRAEDPAAAADFIRDRLPPSLLDEELEWARRHRSRVMWPWETEPRSIASGILDDETYDWATVVEGMLRSGGYPVVVSEDRLMAANELARASTGIDVDHTGSAGLAGLMAVVGGNPRVLEETVAVIFSGARRPEKQAGARAG